MTSLPNLKEFHRRKFEKSDKDFSFFFHLNGNYVIRKGTRQDRYLSRREFSNHVVSSMSDSKIARFRTLRDSCPAGHTFLCKFWHFQMAVSCLLFGLFTPNLGILWISMCSFRLCRSIVANPIIYGLVLSPPTYEIRQWRSHQNTHKTFPSKSFPLRYL